LTGETASQLESGVGDLLDGFQALSSALARHTSVAQISETSLWFALELTKSSIAFIGLLDETGSPDRVFSKTANGSVSMPNDEIERLFVAAAASSSARSASTYFGPNPAFRSYCGQQLIAGGQVVGMMGVASSTGYTAVQQRAFAVLAHQAAAALAIGQLNERRQHMVDTMVNMRGDIDRLVKKKLIAEERAKAAERLERAHEASVATMLAISRHARSGHSIGDFYRRLTASIAELVAARKVLFWQLRDDGTLAAIPGGHGVNDAFVSQLHPVPCDRERDDAASRVVFGDYIFRASGSDDTQDFLHALDSLNVKNAIAVPWRAGEQRLGLVAAYDSRRPEGFSREDTWVLQKAGLDAGLVWQLKYADTDLKKTTDRLQKVDTARQLLLKNVSTAVDKARKRFAGELHDDALQKLTAAELSLQRLHEPDADHAVVLSETEDMLAQTEEALRRLLFEVRPPALEIPGGFVDTIHDRLGMLRSLTGAEVDTDIELPDDVNYEFKTTIFRQVAEAVTNIEKHASATRVQVTLKRDDGAVYGLIVDNGRGFVVSEREHLPGHLGLLALHERSLLAGGWTRIESEPGRGTKVEFWIPIDS
jgi:signal transduction histidine kinase